MDNVKKTPSFGYALFVTLLSFSIIMIPAVFLNAKTQPLFLISWMISIPPIIILGFLLLTRFFSFFQKVTKE